MTDRGVSVTLNYTLSIGIAAVLLTALLFATGDIVENRQQEVYLEELEVVGGRIAANVMAADRLAQTGATSVHVYMQTPNVVGGADYTVEIRPSAGGSEIVLSTRRPELEVTVSVLNSTDLEPGTVNGGAIHIYQAADGDLVVENR